MKFLIAGGVLLYVAYVGALIGLIIAGILWLT